LIERTLARGHKRIPDRSHVNVELFVKRAVETFEMLRQETTIRDRLLIVDGHQDVILSLIRAAATG